MEGNFYPAIHLDFASLLAKTIDSQTLPFQNTKTTTGLHKTSPSDTLYFVSLGLFGVALPQGLIFVGNALAGPAVVAIFQPSIPVWVAAFSAALKLERMTIGKGVGVASAVGGALLLLGADGISEGNTGKEQALGET